MICSQWPAPAEAMDLRQMPYSRMVLQETLRIRPSSWLVPRTAVADDAKMERRVRRPIVIADLLAQGKLLFPQCLRLLIISHSQGKITKRRKRFGVAKGVAHPAKQRQCFFQHWLSLRAPALLPRQKRT